MNRKGWIFVSVVLILAGFMMLPIIWMVSTSLKPTPEIVGAAQSLLPRELTSEQYNEVLFGKVPFFIYLKNSLIVAISSSGIAIVFGNLAAYGFSRYAPEWGNLILSVFLAAQLFPSVMLTIPYYTIMAKAGLLTAILRLL